MKLKLLTYNTAFGSGRNKGDYLYTAKGWLLPNKDDTIIQRIGEFIKKQKPDIACLQEVNEGSRKNNHLNQSKKIERITGLKKVHSVNNTLFPFNYLKLSNVVFTNKKITRTEELKMPVIIFTRNCNKITIENKFTIINAHLSTLVNVQLSHRIAGSRVWQIKNLIEIINSREKPIVLCGDLNCSDNWKEYKLLRKKTDLKELKTEKTYPSWNPQFRLDHIMATPEIEIKQTKVLKSDLSDHLPVISELRV